MCGMFSFTRTAYISLHIHRPSRPVSLCEELTQREQISNEEVRASRAQLQLERWLDPVRPLDRNRPHHAIVGPAQKAQAVHVASLPHVLALLARERVEGVGHPDKVLLCAQ